MVEGYCATKRHLRSASTELPVMACVVLRRRFSVGANPIRHSLLPEAIGLVMEVKKGWSLLCRGTLGDSMEMAHSGHLHESERSSEFSIHAPPWMHQGIMSFPFPVPVHGLPSHGVASYIGIPAAGWAKRSVSGRANRGCKPLLQLDPTLG